MDRPGPLRQVPEGLGLARLDVDRSSQAGGGRCWRTCGGRSIRRQCRARDPRPAAPWATGSPAAGPRAAARRSRSSSTGSRGPPVVEGRGPLQLAHELTASRSRSMALRHRPAATLDLEAAAPQPDGEGGREQFSDESGIDRPPHVDRRTLEGRLDESTGSKMKRDPCRSGGGRATCYRRVRSPCQV